MPALEEAVMRADPAWRLHGYPRPAYVAPETFRVFMDAAERVAQVGLRSTVRQLRMFTRQLELPKQFDTTRFDRDLAPSGLTLEHAREWLPMLTAHAIKQNWREAGWEGGLHATPGR
jgi:hypothetical protein